MNPSKLHKSSLQYLTSDAVSTIPKDLQTIPQWITWRAGPIKTDGKFDKYPIGKNSRGDAWQTPEQWMTFSEAVAAATRNKYSGVGLVLPAKGSDGKFIVALDFDSVDLQNPNDPRIQEIQEIHRRLGEPYIEKSPSGRGLRAFVTSEISIAQLSSSNPLGGKDELFCLSYRWVTVTGSTCGGSGVPDATDEINELAHAWSRRNLGDRELAPQPQSKGNSEQLNTDWNGWPRNKLLDGDGREGMMLAYAGHLRSHGLPQDQIEEHCLKANQDHYEDKLDESIVLDRARRYAVSEDFEPQQNLDYLLAKIDQTDAGNVALLFKLSKGDLRYVSEQKKWIFWDGTQWSFKKSISQVHKLSLLVADAYMRKVKRIEKEIDDPATSADQRKNLKEIFKSMNKWVNKCRSQTGLDSIISIAMRDPRFVISSDELDRDPKLLGVKNGVVDLQTGTLRQNSKEDYILKRTPVIFNPNASTKLIDKFFQEITAYPDGLLQGKVKPKFRPILARYLKKFSGYCLTGLVNEQVMFMLAGKGANGKSVLVDLMTAIIGDYCEVIQTDVLLSHRSASNAEQASPSTRKLAGARCVITSENKDGAQLDVAVVKRHTGDGNMTARALHENPFTFAITHKLVLPTNYPPRVDQMDQAIRGRLHVIPFDMRWNRPGTVDYDPTLPEADKELLNKLKADAEGALKFFIEGAVIYFSEGLSPPDEVIAFTQGYISEQDTLRCWLDDCCIVCPIGEGSTVKTLFASYQLFCSEQGEQMQVDTAAGLGRRLKHMGYEYRKTRDGACYALKLNGKEDTKNFRLSPMSLVNHKSVME